MIRWIVPDIHSDAYNLTRRLKIKKYILVTILLTIFSTSTMSANPSDSKEEQCQKNVTATLEALEATSEKEGKEAKLKDLSALDIMNIAKSKGVCVANEEISRRQK